MDEEEVDESSLVGEVTWLGTKMGRVTTCGIDLILLATQCFAIQY